MAGTSEAIALGVANGLDPKVLKRNHAPQLGRQLGAGEVQPLPGVMKLRLPARLRGGFGTHLMLTTRPGARERDGGEGSYATGGMARNLYAAHSLAGHGGWDFSSIISRWCSRVNPFIAVNTPIPSGVFLKT